MHANARINRIWYEDVKPALGLRLLAAIYSALTALRRRLYGLGVLRGARIGVPVIVVGNLVAGGAGKTPATLAVVRALRERGFSPGIVSRGYGGRPGSLPLAVRPDTPALQAGDEPPLLAARSSAPVYVHPRRALAAKALLDAENVDVVVCDDGLQHYALARDVEIAVIDGRRGFGNGKLLPAGPLREPSRRLRNVAMVIANGELSERAKLSLPAGVTDHIHVMQLKPAALVNLANGERRAPDALATQACAAIAGIGHPQRFFETLAELGYAAECRAFPDHHAYVASELDFANGRPLLMTEKDAVKCRHFASPDWWYLEVEAVLGPQFADELVARLKKK